MFEKKFENVCLVFNLKRQKQVAEDRAKAETIRLLQSLAVDDALEQQHKGLRLVVDNTSTPEQKPTPELLPKTSSLPPHVISDKPTHEELFAQGISICKNPEELAVWFTLKTLPEPSN